MLAKWRSRSGTESGGMRNSGPRTSTTVRFFNLLPGNARMMDMWPRTCWRTWDLLFWQGFWEMLSTLCSWFAGMLESYPFVFHQFEFHRFIADIQGITRRISMAFLLRNLRSFTAEMTAMWQDHVGRALLRPTANTGVNDDSSMAVDEAEEFGLWCHFSLKFFVFKYFHDTKFTVSLISFVEENLKIAEYGVVCANLSHDYKEAVGYNLRKNKAGKFEDITERLNCFFAPSAGGVHTPSHPGTTSWSSVFIISSFLEGVYFDWS